MKVHANNLYSSYASETLTPRKSCCSLSTLAKRVGKVAFAALVFFASVTSLHGANASRYGGSTLEQNIANRELTKIQQYTLEDQIREFVRTRWFRLQVRRENVERKVLRELVFDSDGKLPQVSEETVKQEAHLQELEKRYLHREGFLMGRLTELGFDLDDIETYLKV